MIRPKKKYYRVLDNGCFRIQFLKDGKEKVYLLSCGYMGFQVLGRANWRGYYTAIVER